MTSSNTRLDRELLATLTPAIQPTDSWDALRAIGTVHVELPIPATDRIIAPLMSRGVAEDDGPMALVFSTRTRDGDHATVHVEMPGQSDAVRAIQRGVRPAPSVRVQHLLDRRNLSSAAVDSAMVTADDSVLTEQRRRAPVLRADTSLEAALRETESAMAPVTSASTPSVPPPAPPSTRARRR